MRKMRILLADDHKIVLDGLKSLFEPEFDLVGTVENGRDLVKEAERLCPDIIVADISMPGLNGIEAVRQIKQTHEHIKVIFLTMHLDTSYAMKAFDAGASGYVLKGSAYRELITAINEAVGGKTYIAPAIAGELMQAYQTRRPERLVKETRLTSRQIEILQLLAEGRSAKEIGNILNISSRTVEAHKYKIMHVLKLKTSTDLVKYAIKEGIVHKEIT